MRTEKEKKNYLIARVITMTLAGLGGGVIGYFAADYSIIWPLVIVWGVGMALMTEGIANALDRRF